MVQKHPRRVVWQMHRAGAGLSPKCCVSSFYLGPGRAQACGAGRSVGAQDPFKVPWGPTTPIYANWGQDPDWGGSCSPPTHSGVTPEDSWSQDLWGASSPSHGFPRTLWPHSALLALEAHPPPSLGRTVPEVPPANPFLGLRSVLHPNQGWATPIPCLHPRSPDPLRPPGQAPALPFPPTPAGPGQVDWGVDYLSKALGGLQPSSSAGSILSRCITGLVPRGGGHGYPK